VTGIGPQGSATVAEQLQQRLAAHPDDLLAWHDLAIELRLLGRPAEALAATETAWAKGLHLPEAATVRGQVLIDLGRFDAAADALRQAIALRPDHISAHSALAALLPQIGQGAAALDALDAALRQAPDAAALWFEALNAAAAQRQDDRLLDWSEAAQARFGPDPVLVTFTAHALSNLGRDAEARSRLAPVLSAAPTYAPAQAAQAQILLRLGDLAGAEAAALAVTRLSPDDQLGWALLSIIWRLRDDPREDWLCRYDRLVMPLALELPHGLEGVLTERHTLHHHPADQSLRGGTQTPGHLFQSSDPLIQDLAQRVHAAITAQLASLPHEADHPFLRRLGQGLGFASSWSVRLAGAGFHVGHIHRGGWLSSALYVALPDAVRAGQGEGALTFGVPDAALGQQLAPRRTVAPQEGSMVLFPSYLWHGTTPFESAEARLTVAFDALPVDNQPQAS